MCYMRPTKLVKGIGICILFWQNPRFSGITGRGGGGMETECPPPPRLLTRKFLLTYRKKEARKKGKRGGGEMEKKRRKIVKRKGRWKIENGRRESYKMRREKGGMEKKRRKIVKRKGRWKIENGRKESYKMRNEERFLFLGGLPKWKFATGKKHFTPGKKIRKNDFTPSEKFACYAPA